jgi:hypothetical protein
MSENPAARAFAVKLSVNALAGIVLVGAMFLCLSIFADFQRPVSLLLWIGLILSTAAALVLSLHILFDAMLFRLLASYENEDAGGIAVDRFLSRTGLRPMPETKRSLMERMAGTARLLNFQHAALLVFLAFFVFMATA